MIDKDSLETAVNVLMVAPYVIAGASAVVALFPAPKTSAWLTRLHKALTVVALNVRHAKGASPKIRDE